jgi:hypothetical protein
MRPPSLTSADFAKYPEQARHFVLARLDLLRTLPLTLLVSMLREISEFDWLFPAEQKVLQGQMDGLATLSPKKRADVLGGFERVSVPDKLAELDWVNEPKRFLESLTAWLWSSSQIDQFHSAARDFAAAVIVGTDTAAPIPRASIVVLPTGLDKPGYVLFRKLRAHGTFHENVASDADLAELAGWLASRASKVPEPLAHFYIEGGAPVATLQSRINTVSWLETSAMRAQILKRVTQMTEAVGTGPEMARSHLASLSPAELGLHASGKAGVMEHFALSVLAEGAGTQIFSTTFAQWGAREILRRAQPTSLVVRFGPRRELLAMNEMLKDETAANDAPGSLMDADMGAYYTWVNQQRLAGAETAGFLALSQSRGKAIVIGPGLAKGSISRTPVSLEELLTSLSA